MSDHALSFTVPREVRHRAGTLVLAAVASAFVVVADSWLFGRALLEKGAPDFGVSGALRTVVCMLLAFLFYRSFKPDTMRSLAIDSAPREQTLVLAYGVCVLTVMIASMTTVLLAPQILNSIVRENQPVGYLTDAVLAGAVVLLVCAAAAAARGRRAPILGVPPAVVCGGMALVVFVLLMEEMSWGQHLVGWEAGDLFEGNAQEETNLHNFYTYQFEAVYYTVAFAAFVVLPWAWLAGLSRVLPTAAIFVPPWYFALAACPVAGFLYEEWNLVPYQVWFAGALLIALHLTSASEREATMQRLGMAVVAVMVVAQLAFLANGHEMLDGFELSEIRELVIAVSIAAYAMIVLGRFRERAAGRA